MVTLVCKLCGSDAIRKKIDYFDWEIFRCKECGFRFAQGGEALEIDDHYDKNYFNSFITRDEMDKWAKIYASRLKSFIEYSPNRKLLEIGAGASKFAVLAVKKGFQVDVVDGSPWAVKFLKEHESVNGWVVNLNECDLPLKTYGAIHCSHLLEHLSNPLGLLEQSFSALVPGGIMHLSFPAYEKNILTIRDGLFKLGFANYPYNYQAPDHVSYFDRRCIRETLNKIGFELTSIRRTKFISIAYSFARMDGGSTHRKLIMRVSEMLSPITSRLGFHRDLEIIARRPVC